MSRYIPPFRDGFALYSIHLAINSAPMPALAVLSNSAPSTLSHDLEKWGYEVFEAVSLSEVLHLCEHQNIAAVIVNAGVEAFGIRQAVARQILIELTPESTTEELVSELALLFGNTSVVQ